MRGKCWAWLAACGLLAAVAARAEDRPPTDPPVPAPEAALAPDARNIYLAPEGLTAEQLRQYIERMRAKPPSLQRRPGFAEAVAEASERMLKLSQKGSDQETQALADRFQALHVLCEAGDKQAETQVQALAEAHRDDPRDDVQYEATFHRLRAVVAQADDLPPEQLPEVLDKARALFERKPLGNRHLLLASGVVHIINRLSDEQAADDAYRLFGGMLATSDDRETAEYGRKVQKACKEPGILGQPLEIAGQIVDGQPFEWADYRGKVVLVIFWATWSGPCRAEIPHVQDVWDDYHNQEFDVVGISLDDDREAVLKFLADEGLNWATLLDKVGDKSPKHPLAEKYGVRGVPTNYLVDRQGKVLAQNVFGDALASRVKEALAPPEEKPAP